MSRIMNEKDGKIEVNVDRVEEWRDMTVDAVASDCERDIITSSEAMRAVVQEECLEVCRRIDRVAVPVVAHDMYGMDRDDIMDLMDLVNRMVSDVVARVEDRVEGGVQ